MAKNYYEILGVPENASDSEIEAAFKVKAREVHPDTVPADNPYLRKVASEAFQGFVRSQGHTARSHRRAKNSTRLSPPIASAIANPAARVLLRPRRTQTVVAAPRPHRFADRLVAQNAIRSVACAHRILSISRNPKPEQFSVHGSRHGHHFFSRGFGRQRAHAATLARRRYRRHRNFAFR